MSAPLAIVAVLVGPYLWATARIRRGWPPLRTAAFAAGALALAAALSGPLDAAAGERLAPHMAQHLVLTTLAPALLALGAPVRLALGALPSGPRHTLARALRGPLAATLGRAPVAFGLVVAALLAFHLTPLFDAALAHPVVHAAEHAVLFWTALLSWIVVLGADPLPHAPGAIGALSSLTVTMIAMAAIGAVYLSSDGVLFAHYAHAAGAMADQRAGGTVMWMGGVALLVPAIVVVAARALLREEAQQRRREAAMDMRP